MTEPKGEITALGKNFTSPDEVPFKLKDLPGYLKIYVADVLDLRKGVDPIAIIEDIKNKRSLAGANAWMLMCSIVIASIGLSQNSQAVIIGAMLISPLMSPILGIGLSVGINDMETLRGSLAHFTIAIIIALLTSYIYFTITPFDDLTSEISARTEPTFLDIFVAIFGGLAGIISAARKDISTTIPGVAIATALMPPLCVTGYGLAMGNWRIASASFYLFFLNTFFVALATYMIVRFLKFPYRQYINKKTYRKNLALIIAFSLTLVVPSFFIFRNVLRSLQFKHNLELFKDHCLGENNIYLDSYNADIDPLGNKILYLKVYGSVISMDHKDEYLNCLADLGVTDYDLNIISTSNVNIDQVEILEANLKSIAAEIEKDQQDNIATTRLINYYQKTHIDSTLFDHLKDEIKKLYPNISEFGLANIHTTNYNTTQHDMPTIMIKWPRQSRQKTNEDNLRIEEFLKVRIGIDSLKVISY